MAEKNKRVLIIATVVKKHIMQFHIPTLKLFKEMGWETAVAARNDYDNPDDCQIPYCDHFYDLPFERFPFAPQNIKCFKALKRIIDSGDYHIIHCHTPVGGVLGRLAARAARKKGSRVLYTAHGFHFYRGAPFKNWLLYYPIEKLCARFANAILTINEEDFTFAQKHFQDTRVFYLPGIGLDTARFSRSNHATNLRSSFGINEDLKLILSVGELNDNKNHKTIIKALASSQLRDVHYFIVGEGSKRKQLENFVADLQIADRVHFLGYRKDIPALLHMSDVFVFPSYREGLSVAVMEAMAAGVPVVVSRIRGNVDLIEHGVNGFLCDPGDVDSFSTSIRKLLDDSALAENFCNASLRKIKDYDTCIVMDRLQKIYCDQMSTKTL